MVKEFPGYFKVTCYMLITIMVIYGMVTAQSLLIPVAVAVLFTFLLMPVSRWLESLKFPRSLAIILSIALMIIVLGGVIFFLSSQFMTFGEEMPILKEKLSEKFSLLQGFVSDKFDVSEKRQMVWIEGQLANAMSSGGEVFGNIFSATGNFLATATLIPIYIFFFTFYRNKIMEFVRYFTPVANHQLVMDVMHSTSKVSQKYLVGLLIDITILAILNSIGFLLLGINHAIMLGTIAGILNIIPYVGVLIGSIFPIAVALLTKDSIWYAVGALGVCVFVQFLDNNFITPKVVGSSVSINPLATLVALIVGGMIWGLAGMMLFIPFLGMMKVVFDNVDSLKPFSFLIGEEEHLRNRRTKIF